MWASVYLHGVWKINSQNQILKLSNRTFYLLISKPFPWGAQVKCSYLKPLEMILSLQFKASFQGPRVGEQNKCTSSVGE